MTSSGSSFASDSTISTASLVPATTRSSWLSAISSSVGLSTYSLPTKPTRAAPIGPMNGAPDRQSAAEDATSGVEFLLVVDREGHEIDALARFLGGDDGRQNFTFPVGGDDGAVGLAG